MFSAPGSTLGGVSLTVHLPAELATRLAAEAARRGLEVDQVAAELLDHQLPTHPKEDRRPTRRRLSFAATLTAEPELAERAEEILAELTRRDAG